MFSFNPFTKRLDKTKSNEEIDDQVGGLVAAGIGIAKSYNDGAGSLTFSRPELFSHQAGRYYPSSWFVGSLTAAAVSAGTIYYIPYPIYESKTYLSQYLRCTAAVNGGKSIQGIFNSANGIPTSRLGTPGETTMVGTGAQDLEIVISQLLPASLYFLAVCFDNIVTVNIYPTTALGFLGLTNADKSSGRAYNHYRQTRAYDGTLPTSAASLVGSVNSCPMLMLGL